MLRWSHVFLERALPLINNDKNKQKILRQRLVSSILTLTCMTPVLATNEQEEKSSTSSWVRTVLELLLCAGCVAGGIREFQNRNTIDSRDAEILKLNNKLEETKKGLTEEQQKELTSIKTLIETVYGRDYAKYLKITDESVKYKVESILELPEAKTLKLTNENFNPPNEHGIVQTYIRAKSLELNTKIDYATVYTIPTY